MGRLTTHVLDTAQGCPAALVSVALYRLTDARELVGQGVTNQDGRLDAPLMEGATFEVGTYELIFQVGAYFSKSGLSLPTPPFVDEVVLRFGIAELTSTTMCRCWFRPGATRPTAAVDDRPCPFPG